MGAQQTKADEGLEVRIGSQRRQSKVQLCQDYGMWVMPIEAFLSMDKLLPHQELRKQNKLVQWTPQLPGPVFFMSHQWLSYGHPDPELEQVRTFQGLLRNLRAGQLDVPLAQLHKCSFDTGLAALGKDYWVDVVPKAYIWLDFCSMPQPSQEDTEGVSQADHRHLCTDLEKAVRSIPYYVENSDYFFVLAPPADHKDRALELLDQQSWASRGWCRLEAQARALSTNAGPVIVVSSPLSAEMMVPGEWYKTPVGTGDFTCCRLNHQLDIGGKKVDISCDKLKVAEVLSVMYDYKLAISAPGSQEWRWLKSREFTLFNGLDHPYATFKPQGVDEFLREFKFETVNDDLESGWVPLRFAALKKDGELVKGLIARGAELEAPLKEDKLSNYHMQGQTVAHTAAVFGDASCVAAMGVDTVRFFAENHPEQLSRQMENPLFGSIGVPMFQNAAKKGNTEVFEFLLNHVSQDGECVGDRLAAGEGKSGNYRWLNLGAFPNRQVLEKALAAGADPNEVVVLNGVGKTLAGVSRACLRSGIGKDSFMVIFLASLEGQRPLHAAVAAGNVGVVEALLAAGADPRHRNAYGESALDIAQKKQQTRCADLLRKELARWPAPVQSAECAGLCAGEEELPEASPALIAQILAEHDKLTERRGSKGSLSTASGSNASGRSSPVPVAEFWA